MFEYGRIYRTLKGDLKRVSLACKALRPPDPWHTPWITDVIAKPGADSWKGSEKIVAVWQSRTSKVASSFNVLH